MQTGSNTSDKLASSILLPEYTLEVLHRNAVPECKNDVNTMANGKNSVGFEYTDRAVCSNEDNRQLPSYFFGIKNYGEKQEHQVDGSVSTDTNVSENSLGSMCGIESKKMAQSFELLFGTDSENDMAFWIASLSEHARNVRGTGTLKIHPPVKKICEDVQASATHKNSKELGENTKVKKSLPDSTSFSSFSSVSRSLSHRRVKRPSIASLTLTRVAPNRGNSIAQPPQLFIEWVSNPNIQGFKPFLSGPKLGNELAIRIKIAREKMNKTARIIGLSMPLPDQFQRLESSLVSLRALLVELLDMVEHEKALSSWHTHSKLSTTDPVQIELDNCVTWLKTTADFVQDTSEYIERVFIPNGTEASLASNCKPRLDLLPRFIGISELYNWMLYAKDSYLALGNVERLLLSSLRFHHCLDDVDVQQGNISFPFDKEAMQSDKRDASTPLSFPSSVSTSSCSTPNSSSSTKSEYVVKPLQKLGSFTVTKASVMSYTNWWAGKATL